MGAETEEVDGDKGKDPPHRWTTVPSDLSPLSRRRPRDVNHRNNNRPRRGAQNLQGVGAIESWVAWPPRGGPETGASAGGEEEEHSR